MNYLSEEQGKVVQSPILKGLVDWEQVAKTASIAKYIVRLVLRQFFLANSLIFAQRCICLFFVHCDNIKSIHDKSYLPYEGTEQ